MKALKLLWLAAIPLLLGGELYQWTDEKGVVTYSQRPPPDRAAERISTRDKRPLNVVSREDADAAEQAEPPADTGSTLSVTTDGEPSVEQQAQIERLEQANRARLAEMERIRATNCRNARQRLEQLRVEPRLHVTDEDGERRAISDEERQVAIAEAERSVGEHC